MDRIAEALQLDSIPKNDNAAFKAAFSAKAVREIHEAILELWPPNADIAEILGRDSGDVSGLYVGDYDFDYLTRSVVRHSIYARKLLLVDPFVYPASVKDQFNPILNPDQHRSQTLKNVRIWFAMSAWIKAGIVEVIRTPADFDRRLAWESMQRQQLKFEQSEELQRALEASTEEFQGRHSLKLAAQHMLMSLPDDALEAKLKEMNVEDSGIPLNQFMAFIQRQRENDPEFLAPLGRDMPSQLHQMSAGTSYDIAKMVAKVSKSHLVTDIAVRWKEIELDRPNDVPEIELWSPFAHAMQNTTFRYLNSVGLDHALSLREDGRLENMRHFLRKVWKTTNSGEVYSDKVPLEFAEELTHEVQKAEIEWAKITEDLTKHHLPTVIAGVASPLILDGTAGFAAAIGAAAVGVAGLVGAAQRRRNFQIEFPAAFFTKIKEP